jgi:hypothetical protein
MTPVAIAAIIVSLAIVGARASGDEWHDWPDFGLCDGKDPEFYSMCAPDDNTHARACVALTPERYQEFHTAAQQTADAFQAWGRAFVGDSHEEQQRVLLGERPRAVVADKVPVLPFATGGDSVFTHVLRVLFGATCIVFAISTLACTAFACAAVRRGRVHQTRSEQIARWDRQDASMAATRDSQLPLPRVVLDIVHTYTRELRGTVTPLRAVDIILFHAANYRPFADPLPLHIWRLAPHLNLICDYADTELL